MSEIRRDKLDDFIEVYATGGMKIKLIEASKIVDKGFDVIITNPENLYSTLLNGNCYGTILRKI